MKKLEEILVAAPLFANMDTKEISLLINCLHMYRKSYKKGQYIHQINDIYKSIGMVLSGKVHMIGEDFWGNRNLISEFSDFQFYGDAHSMTETPMFFDIVAVKNSEILFINTTNILSTCHNSCHAHQQLIRNFVQIMSKKKLLYMHKADFLSRRTIREKLTAYLSEEARIQKKTAFQVPYNRQEIANFLAVDRSSLSRELAKMKKEGLLNYRHNYFELYE